MDHDRSGASSEKLFGTMADCLSHAGTREFNNRFLKLVDDVIEADQCMVFSFRGGSPSCYLSYNMRSLKGAQSLASDYVGEGYRSDPLVRELLELGDHAGVKVHRLADIKPRLRPNYFDRFFVKPGLVDKLSILARGHGEVLMISLYRFAENGRFSQGDPQQSEAFLSMLAQGVLLNYSLDSESTLKSPLASLSTREADVCRGILSGKTGEAIAADLDITPNSVATYRKRAYAKLGVHSKSALFALCNARTQA